YSQIQGVRTFAAARVDRSRYQSRSPGSYGGVDVELRISGSGADRCDGKDMVWRHANSVCGFGYAPASTGQDFSRQPVPQSRTARSSESDRLECSLERYVS